MSFLPGAVPPAPPAARARWFLVSGGGLAVRPEGDPLPERADVLALGLDPGAAEYVGRCAGDDCFVLSLEPSLALPDTLRVEGLRALYPRLGDPWFAAAGRALQLAAFADTHRHCGRCGGRTRRLRTEHAVRCDGCEHTYHPRVAPAIIVLVRRGPLALLGRSPRFPEGMYSTLAGFVEPGESLEEALAREVREEVGVEVGSVRYFGSQPWPFPHSLMVGFFAEHQRGELQVDGHEIVDARWFSADALPLLPPRPSIARRMIEAWLDELGAGSRG